MTVARAAQDEVEAVRREMQEKVKAAQEVADRQVRMKLSLPNTYSRLKQLAVGPAICYCGVHVFTVQVVRFGSVS